MATDELHSVESTKRPAESKVAASKLRTPATGDEEALPDKVSSWPHFVRIEFIAGLAMLVFLNVWSLAIDAPLEEPANVSVTPNPSKAPWYFLGLQEMLVYFDPWLAGVVFPALIIVGLMVIPYIDLNPQGNGYYTFRERWLAISVFFLGFHGLWIVPIVVGVFFRGPGWNLFFPWETWDAHRVVALDNVDWPYLLGFRGATSSFLVGGLTLFAHYGVGFAVWKRWRSSPLLTRLGGMRYAIVAFLLLTMALLPLKMVLRFVLNVKYLWVTPWFNI